MSNTYFNISDKLRLYEFDGMLDQYGDAAAAYSLRKLRSGYTGSAIRVRRSSDNTERDMGFWNNELDTIALLDWVNEEYVRYESDFRASNPYTGFIQGLDHSVGESVAGVDDAIKLTLTGGARAHNIAPVLNSTSIAGQEFRLEFDYYIPSTNALVDNILIVNFFGDGNPSVNVLDEWTSVSITGPTVDLPGNVDLFFRARAGSNTSPDADGDVYYLKNIRATQLTADGYVHTWYDQSANANHAVQGTATAQPKIVDAGVVVTDNGKAAITMDGVDDYLEIAGFNSVMSINNSHSSFSVTSSTLSTNSTIFQSSINNSDRFVMGYTGANNIAVATYNGTAFNGKVISPLDVTAQNSLTHLWETTTMDGYVNDAQMTLAGSAGTGGAAIALIGSRTDGFSKLNGNIQELTFYSEDKSSSRTDIEFNINTYYDIY